MLLGGRRTAAPDAVVVSGHDAGGLGRNGWHVVIPTLVPVDVRGPGTITVRQTTFIEVVLDRGGKYRIHFEDKKEFALTPGAYAAITLEAAHPLLVDYLQPWASLYISAIASDVEAVAKNMESAVAGFSDGWRSLNGYANGSARELLGGGHGLLLHGPVPACELAAQILERHVPRHTMLQGHAALAPDHVVLVLGRSYVVAGAFSFERRPS